MTIFPLFASYISTIVVTENTSALDHNKLEFKGDNGCTKISTDLKILKKYPKIEKILLKKFKDFAKDTFLYDNDFSISTSWFTKAEKGQSSEFHSHKNSFYSGVYYYDEYSDETGKIIFSSPISSFTDFLVCPSKYIIQNSTEWNIAPSKGLLVLFPSYLKHKIDRHLDEVPRYSLAFNIVPRGEYGEGDSVYNPEWFK